MQNCSIDVVRAAEPKPNNVFMRPTDNLVLASGCFFVEHIREGETIGRYKFKNGITNEGKNKILDVTRNRPTPGFRRSRC